MGRSTNITQVTDEDVPQQTNPVWIEKLVWINNGDIRVASIFLSISSYEQLRFFRTILINMINVISYPNVHPFPKSLPLVI